jgi:hypothetical protein
MSVRDRVRVRSSDTGVVLGGWWAARPTRLFRGGFVLRFGFVRRGCFLLRGGLAEGELELGVAAGGEDDEHSLDFGGGEVGGVEEAQGGLGMAGGEGFAEAVAELFKGSRRSGGSERRIWVGRAGVRRGPMPIALTRGSKWSIIWKRRRDVERAAMDRLPSGAQVAQRRSRSTPYARYSCHSTFWDYCSGGYAVTSRRHAFL